MGRHAYILVGNFGKVTDGFARKGRVMVRVSVVGAKGRMGSHVVDAVNGAQDMQLAFALDAGDDLMRITPENTDVVVEFTVPSVSLDNVLALVKRGVDVVVGTTGWTDERLAKVTAALAEAPRGDQAVFIAPNFAISAVLADYFAKVAAPYFESAEVIELHHPTKVDAPSGTAIHTARAIADARKAAGLGAMPDATETDGGSRGQVVDGVHVHAVRLRGLNAHEEVLLGNAGKRDVFDAEFAVLVVESVHGAVLLSGVAAGRAGAWGAGWVVLAAGAGVWGR